MRQTVHHYFLFPTKSFNEKAFLNTVTNFIKSHMILCTLVVGAEDIQSYINHDYDKKSLTPRGPKHYAGCGNGSVFKKCKYLQSLQISFCDSTSETLSSELESGRPSAA